MAPVKKLGFPSKLVNFTLRLPPDLKNELDIAADFLHAKDPTELVRGWLRGELEQLNYNGNYQKFKAEKLAKKASP